MLSKIKTLIWNTTEGRLRLLWRLTGQLLTMGLLLAISQLLIVMFAGATSQQAASNPRLADFTNLDSPWGQLLITVSGIAVAASVWFSSLVFDRRNFQSLGLSITKSWRQDFAFGLGLGALLMSIIFSTEWALGWIQVQTLPGGLSGEFPSLPLLLIPLVTFIVVGVYEELLNRGYLIKNLAEGLSSLKIGTRPSILVAALINSIVFALLHAANPNSSSWSTINIGLAGLFLAAGFLFTGELAIPIGIHISWNFFQGIIFGFPVSGASLKSFAVIVPIQSGPDLWTGGQFGPEGGLLGTLAVILGTGLIAAWVYYKTGTLRLDPVLCNYQKKTGIERTNSNPAAGQTGLSTRERSIPQKPDHLIWDWNGTLLDDRSLCLEIINAILESRHLPVLTLEKYQEVFDFPVKDYYQRLGFDFSVEPFEDISTKFIATYEVRRPECQLMAGAREALDTASKLGISQSIISASKLAYLAPAVKEYGIEPYFARIMGLDNHHAAGKQALVEEFLAANNLDPAKVLMIGDTVHDAAITKSLGLNCILIPGGHHSKDRLQHTTALVIDSLPDFINMLRSWNHDQIDDRNP
jgi:phosphoglycolate phosphatase-like HAD superfamily hydrolase/membrane protease YdiL (CAAX protease family)